MADEVFSIQVDVSQALGFFDRLHAQAPFAIATGLNRTAEDALAAIRAHLPTVFTIRQKNITRFVAPQRLPTALRARKDKLWALIETEGIGKILNPFQFGIPHMPAIRGQGVPVPSSHLRPTKQAVVPKVWFPHNLGLTPRRDASGRAVFNTGKKRGGKARARLNPKTGTTIYLGKRGTFRIQKLGGRDQVFLRTGKGKEGVKLLWTLKPQVRRPRVLEFYEIAQRTANQRMVPNLKGAWELAIRTAKR